MKCIVSARKRTPLYGGMPLFAVIVAEKIDIDKVLVWHLGDVSSRFS